MALPMTPIFTQTVGAGGTGSVIFNNIPQHFTDLRIVISARQSGSATNAEMYVQLNGNASAVYSTTWLVGSGSAASSARGSNNGAVVTVQTTAATATSNTFGSIEITIPNYTTSNSKQMLIDSVTENNQTAADARLLSALFQSSSPVSIVRFDATNGLLIQNSTFSLYGIIRPGA